MVAKMGKFKDWMEKHLEEPYFKAEVFRAEPSTTQFKNSFVGAIKAILSAFRST